VTLRLVALGCLLLLPQVLAAQGDSSAVEFRPRFSSYHFELRSPAVLRAPWLGAPRLTPGQIGRDWDSTVAVALDSTRRERDQALRLASIYGISPVNITSTDTTPGRRRGLLGLNQDVADLDIDGQARLELRTERLRNERCSPLVLLDPNSGCRGSFTPPRLDAQISMRSGGTIGRRVHVNVDYDDQRDFSANNNVQVY
jgi:hypothetical protein